MTAKSKGTVQCSLNTCERYPYCWIHLRSKEGLKVQNSNIPHAGRGLFATKNFRKKERVAKYSGHLRDRPVDNNDYVFQVSKAKFLDAEDKENHAGRFINDPKGTGKNPNVRFSKTRRVYDDPTKRKNSKDRRYYVPMVANRNIRKGQELLVSYGSQFWKP